MKERINWIKENDAYIAKPVNIPGVCVQAESFEEMIIQMKDLCKSWINHYLKILEQDEPFEFKEFTNGDQWLGEDYQNKQELDKYKELFGEINY